MRGSRLRQSEMSQNIQTNSVKFPVDLQIGVPQNGNPVRLKPLITHPVALGSFALKMLRTVQLNHRLFRRDKEIDDIPAKHFLPVTVTGSSFRKSYQRCRSSLVIFFLSSLARAESFGSWFFGMVLLIEISSMVDVRLLRRRRLWEQKRCSERKASPWGEAVSLG